MNAPAPRIASPRPLTADGSSLPLNVDPGAQAFLLRLGRALHRRGLPSHRLEEAMLALCARLGVSATFFATPTAIFVSFDGAERPEVHLVRTATTASDLGKLSDLDAVATSVARGELSSYEGLERVDAIEAQPPRYRAPLITACYALNSAAASVFFGGGLREVGTAFVIGLVTGLLSQVGARAVTPWRAFEPLAAFCATMLAALAAHVFGPVSTHTAVLAGLIALLPGYTLTVAIAELAHGHLASGSARITSAFMMFLTLAFGVALGSKCAELWVGASPLVTPVALPAWAQALALGTAASTFAIIFRVKRRDLFWVMAIAVLGFSGTRAGSHILGPELGVFMGALTVGVFSNLYARILHRPAVVPLFPGIMLLVPGSIGFRSLSSLMAHDVVGGVQTAFTMILMAVALVAGLVLASNILPARRAL